MKLRYEILAILLLCLSGCSGSKNVANNQLFVFDADERLFTAYAFMNAAGYDHDWRDMHPIRKEVREQLKKSISPDFQRKIRGFYNSHGGGNFSSYGSYALLSSGPPEFQIIYDSPDHMEFLKKYTGLSEMLKEFYVEGKINALWMNYKPLIQSMNDEYKPFAAEALNDIVKYCRVEEDFYKKNAGKIYFAICPQMGYFTAFTDEINGDIYLINGPSVGRPGRDDFYHEALHYIINPLTEKYLSEVNKLEELLPVSKEKGSVGYSRWENVVNESFVRTIDKILQGRYYNYNYDETLKIVKDEYKLGFILCLYLYEHLPEYEKSGETLREYYLKLISEIDIEKEKMRWSKFWENESK